MSDSDLRGLAKRVYETLDLELARRLVRELERARPEAPFVQLPDALDDRTKLATIPSASWGFTVQEWGKAYALAVRMALRRMHGDDSVGSWRRRHDRARDLATLRDLARGLKTYAHVKGMATGKVRAKAVRLVRAAGLEATDEQEGRPRRRRGRFRLAML